MGNNGSSGVNGRRRNSSSRSHPLPPPPMRAQTEITPNRYFFAVATPYSNTPAYYQYPGSYPLPPPPTTPVPLPVADHHHTPAQSNWVSGRYVCRYTMQPPVLHVQHQKAVIIRNDVNLKKETLRIEPDEVNPGKYLVAFTLDATMAGRLCSRLQ